MRTIRFAFILAIAAAVSLVATSVQSATATHLGTLRPGKGIVAVAPRAVTETMFWEACEATGKCFEYSVDVADGGRRLRAILESPDNSDIWGIRLRSPAGRTIEPLAVEPSEVGRSSLRTNAWAYEVPPVIDPEAGRWEVLVVPVHVTDGTFRLRLQLDRHLSASLRQDLPNLRPVPAFGFTFAAPVQPARPPGGNRLAPVPLEAAGQRPVSCMADETASDGVTRCLRFGLGLANDGDGPLDLRFDGTKTSGEMRQHIRGSGPVATAGPRYEIHLSHLHFHNEDMVTTQLFRVASGLEPAGASTKHGFCLDDSILFEPYKSNSEVQYSEPSSCEFVEAGVGEGRMVQTRGWADIYPWYLPGMYVDFGGLADGEYVLRSIADPAGRIVETDEDDNVAYSWINVSGDSCAPGKPAPCVSVLERGWGQSPWDVHKSVIPPSPWMV